MNTVWKIPNLTVRLYNNNPEPNVVQEARIFQMITYNQSSQNQQLLPCSSMKEIKQKIEFPIDIKIREHTIKFCKFTIGSNQALLGGRLIINCPKWLRNKTLCMQLPDDRKLVHGLKITLFKPDAEHCTRFNYYKPAWPHLARITIAVHDGTSNGDVLPEVISLRVDSNEAPVITKLSATQPVGSIIHEAMATIDATSFEQPVAENNVLLEVCTDPYSHRRPIKTSLSSGYRIDQLLADSIRNHPK